jgi:hypothetical protein
VIRIVASFALLVAATAVSTADTIDHPSVGRALRGSAHISGKLTRERGFVSHRYRAVTDGFVKITLATGAKRPYLRVLTVPSPTRRGEGWSTNEPTIVVRVARGNELELVATLAVNITRGSAADEAPYELATVELTP